MPSLAGAVTRLTLACVPGRPTWTQLDVPSESTKPVTDTYVPVLTQTVRWVLGQPRPDDGRFTAMTLAGVPGRVNVFTDKTPAVADAKPVVDTYIAVVTLGDVTAALLQLSDDYVPRLTMSAAVSQSRAVVDRYVPVLLMPLPNMVKSGTFPKFAADTFVPVLGMVAAKPQQDAQVVDSYVPVLTLTATVSGSAVRFQFDTYVPVLVMDYSLSTASGTVSFERADTYVPVLGMTAQRGSGGEVDKISIYSRPYGRIRIVEE